jgi:putative transposase
LLNPADLVGSLARWLMDLAVALHALMKTRTVLQMENLALRHQLLVLRQSTSKRPAAEGNGPPLLDRNFAAVRRLALQAGDCAAETVVGWHRTLFRAFWTWKIRHGKPGQPGVSRDTRELIPRMSRENPTWGAPRIHGELLKLGIEIAESTVSKYLVRGRRPPSQTWRTFLQNHISGMVSVDFFTVPTVRFQVLYVFLVLAHERRRIVHVGVTPHPTAEWTAQQLREAFPWDTAPRLLLRDRDRIFGQEFVEQVEAFGFGRCCRLRARHGSGHTSSG